MQNQFYRIFEEKFRGSRELIKSRLNIYLAFLEPLHSYFKQVAILDLGCGRGEWLELLAEHGFIAQGIDLNDAMLGACRERGLSVCAGDALEFIQKIPDASLEVISGFHIVEHLSFEYLQTLIQDIERVLKPGGLLIFETPNPENIVVGSSSFYLDPTHQRPIPPSLLAFLSEYSGFKQIKILRLQENQELLNPSLLDVLSGVSPDYAIIAQKGGADDLLKALSPLFNHEYGVTLKELTNRYQENINSRFELTEQQALAAENRAQQEANRSELAEQRALAAENRAQQEANRFLQAEQRAQNADLLANQAYQRANNAEHLIVQLEFRAREADLMALQARQQTVEQTTLANELDAKIKQQLVEIQALKNQLEQQQQILLTTEQLNNQLKSKVNELGGHSHHWYTSYQTLEQILDASNTIDRIEYTALEEKIQFLEKQIKFLGNNSHHWYTVAIQHQQLLNAVYSSTSWKITHPIRNIKLFLKSFLTPYQTVKKIAKKSILKYNHKLYQYPQLRVKVLKLIRKLPSPLEQHLRLFIQANTTPTQISNHIEPTSEDINDINPQLPSQAQASYEILRQL